MTNRSWDKFFTAEDFIWPEGPLGQLSIEHMQEIAKLANALLREAISKAPTVYGKKIRNKSYWDYGTEKAYEDTHSASLINIKELEKK